jgi:peptide deformylase
MIAELPDYVRVDMEASDEPPILRQVAAPVTFPLSDQDLRDVRTLEAKFDGEENICGLAAPQIGISKQIIVFAAPEDPEIKSFGKDFVQFMEKSIWFNPVLEPLGTECHQDYEACFSVKDRAGLVNRYMAIRYRAYNEAGELLEGICEGFLARILQHEVDHLQGRLFIDLVDPEKLMSIDAYRKMRMEKSS